jgi:pimeloyl-ACP methyl ester carboxylesterase
MQWTSVQEVVAVSTHIRVDWLQRVFPSVSNTSTALLSADEGTDVAIVFVHGFTGHPMSTWSQFHDVVNLSGDPCWRQADLYFLGYDSARLDIRGATEVLLNFLRVLLPVPPAELFSVRFKEDTLWVRRAFNRYQKLYLVGHSLGGVLARNAVRLGLRDKIRKMPPGLSEMDLNAVFAPETLEYYLANAHLRLFAPAIAGARPGGLLGVLNAVGMSAVLAWSRSKHELDQSSVVLSEIRQETEHFAERLPQLRAFSGVRIAWAGEDNVVAAVEYRCDNVGYVIPRATHKSICKPCSNFLAPIDFIGLYSNISPVTEER